MSEANKLTEVSEKEEIFINEYLNTLNATQAYLRVWTDVTYGSATVLSSKLLAKVSVKARVKEEIAQRNENLQISSEFVVRNLIDVANKCQEAVPVLEFDPIAKEMVQKRDDMGNPVYQFDSHGANKALELLGKHTGAFERDNKQKQPDSMDAEKYLALLEAARQGVK